MTEKVTRTICFDCHAKCGILVHTDGDKITKVEGDPNHPNSLGMLCCKAFSAAQIHEHPDRLKYPMKRVGPRGSGQWERITWDEAYDTIYNKMQEIIAKHGPGSFCFSQGTGRGWNHFHFRFSASYGVPGTTLGVSHVCLFPVIGPCMFVWGYYNALDGCDLDHANCCVHWGINPATSFPGIHMPKFFQARKRGMKLIVIDPRFTDLAAKADIWLQIKPGTDGALALTMCNILIQEDLYDHEFVENWCYGFEEFAEHVKEWTPERCEEETWVPADKIVEAVHMIMENGPTTEAAMIGTGMHDNGITNGFTLAAFWALTGYLDRKGGITSNEFWDRMLQNEMTKQDEARKEFSENGYRLLGSDIKPFLAGGLSIQYPRAVFAAMKGTEGGDNYPVRGLVTVANDPVMAFEDSQEVFDSLMGLEFFCMKDYFMTPSGRYADMLLPSAHWVERDDQVDEEFYMDPCPFVTADKAVDPPGEGKSDWEFSLALGKRLKPEWWPWENSDEMHLYRFKEFYDYPENPDITIEEMREAGYLITAGGDKRVYEKYRKGLERPDGKLGFRTPSGRIELWNSGLQSYGYDPLPTYYRSQLYDPDRGFLSRYPLILITGCRDYPYYHSAWSNIPMQREIEPDPYVEIHPEAAIARGISDGDWVWIFNNTGRIKSRARVTKAVDPRVVSIPRLGWKEACKELGLQGFGMFDANPNTIIPQEPSEPKYGTSSMKSWCCEIERMVD